MVLLNSNVKETHYSSQRNAPEAIVIIVSRQTNPPIFRVLKNKDTNKDVLLYTYI